MGNNGFTTKVFTDHNPLIWLKNFKNDNRKLLNWNLILQSYNITINHIKGSDNVLADTLSRI